MNRDAKIMVVVILIIVGLLVIVWGRGDSTEEDAGLPPTNIEDPLTKDPGALDLKARSPDSAAVLVKPDVAALPPAPDVTRPKPETSKPPVETKPPKPSAEPSSGKTWVYTVRPGDAGLEPIARRELGDGTRWPEIAKLNHLAAPYRIFPKQKLKMPPRGRKAVRTRTAVASTPTPRAAPTPKITGKRKYIVRAGDIGLVEIAREQLGDPKRWKDIVTLNNLSPPFMVTAGDVLWLPTYEQ